MVEIGCVELVDRVVTGEVYHAYFNPQRDMPAEAFNVHGLSEAFLADKPLFVELADELLEFLGDAPLVAHNASFDFGFLNAELERAGRTSLPESRMIDTIALARKRHPGAKMTLDALCTRYGIDRSHRVKHGALLDAELLAQVYVELTGGRQIGLELGVNQAPGAKLSADGSLRQAAVTGTASSGERPFRQPRAHGPSEEEIARHRAFLEGIESPLWQQ